MLDWIVQNIATIAVAAILFAIVAAIVISMIKTRKKGGSSCSCGCADCPMSGKCHSE